MKTNEVESVEKSFDAVEVPVTMGGIKFTLDVTQAFLNRDGEGKESLEVTVAVRGIDSKGQPLEVGNECTLCVS